MPWTVVDDDHDFIHVRAIIDSKNEPQEITALIDALVKRATKHVEPSKEVTHERPDA
jgi:hypothetical protein